MITNLLDLYHDQQLVHLDIEGQLHCFEKHVGQTRLLEIGGFLGGSMRRWLMHSPKLAAVLLERRFKWRSVLRSEQIRVPRGLRLFAKR